MRPDIRLLQSVGGTARFVFPGLEDLGVERFEDSPEVTAIREMLEEDRARLGESLKGI